MPRKNGTLRVCQRAVAITLCKVLELFVEAVQRPLSGQGYASFDGNSDKGQRYWTNYPLPLRRAISRGVLPNTVNGLSVKTAPAAGTVGTRRWLYAGRAHKHTGSAERQPSLFFENPVSWGPTAHVCAVPQQTTFSPASLYAGQAALK